MSLSPRTKAIFQALLVTFLWSSSVILVKIGLHGIPAIMFAALRYGIAFLFLLPIVLRSADARRQMASLDRRSWLLFMLLGIVFYTVTQGAQFLSLVYLPAVTQSLFLNFTVLVTAILGITFLNERPRPTQWIGMGIFMVGVLVYFYPLQLPRGILIGIAFGTVQVFSNALSGVLGRYVNRDSRFLPLVVTVVSMGTGALGLLLVGLAFEEMPRLELQQWAIIIWLAAANTAFAFTLWNKSLQRLSAVESSTINSTMLIQIAAMAWILLGESITDRGLIGLATAFAGILLVQIRRSGHRKSEHTEVPREDSPDLGR